MKNIKMYDLKNRGDKDKFILKNYIFYSRDFVIIN